MTALASIVKLSIACKCGLNSKVWICTCLFQYFETKADQDKVPPETVKRHWEAAHGPWADTGFV